MKQIKFKKDIIIIFIIIVLPFAFYLYMLAPYKTHIWQTRFFKIDAGYYEYVRNYLWINGYKLMTILLISIWFITCKYWWRLVLVVPLAFGTHNYLIFLNDKIKLFKNIEIIHSLPIIVILVILLIWLSKWLNYYTLKKNYKSELNDEIYFLLKELSVFRRKDFFEVKKQLKYLKKEKDLIDKKEYLTKLITLRDSMNREY